MNNYQKGAAKCNFLQELVLFKIRFLIQQRHKIKEIYIHFCLLKDACLHKLTESFATCLVPVEPVLVCGGTALASKSIDPVQNFYKPTEVKCNNTAN